MTSQQVHPLYDAPRLRRVKLTHALCMLLLLLQFTACTSGPRVKPAPDLNAPYPARQVWAVAPLRNESGTRHADGIRLADDLTQRLERVEGLSTLPVNRVLAAMQQMGIEQVTTVDEAMRLRGLLGVDGLVVGSITGYDAYPPPSMGLALELYADQIPRGWNEQGWQTPFDAQRAERSPIHEWTVPYGSTSPRSTRSTQFQSQPVSVVSGYFDANTQSTQKLMLSYAHGQGTASTDLDATAMYELDMNLYQQFVSYALTLRLLEAERTRLLPDQNRQQTARP